MNTAFYTAALGASMQMKHMDVQANNIANINTYGYKADISGFSNLMYGYFLGAEEEMSYRGSGTVLIENSIDFKTGALQGTDRVFDFAIDGEGFFALYDPKTEEITFDRDGSFTMAEATLDDNGTIGWRLSDGSGRFVVNQAGNFIDIDPQADMLTHTPESLGIGVFDFELRDGLLRNGPSGLMNIEKNGGIQAGTGKVLQGFLENSNVELSQAMTKVIEAQRLYTYASKMLITSDEVEAVIIGLKS